MKNGAVALSAQPLLHEKIVVLVH